jgi:hypothetical protein
MILSTLSPRTEVQQHLPMLSLGQKNRKKICHSPSHSAMVKKIHDTRITSLHNIFEKHAVSSDGTVFLRALIGTQHPVLGSTAYC